MPALPKPKYAISELYMYREFGSREEYAKATGQEAPPWNPGRSIKQWYDPEAAKSPKRAIIYDRVLAVSEIGVPLSGTDGKPFLEPLVLAKDEAATVNFTDHRTPTNQTFVPIPVPLRALEPEEQLDFDFEGVVVRNTAWLETHWGAGYTDKDRELLQAIARKLNVPA
jgi:hypothetical protein